MAILLTAFAAGICPAQDDRENGDPTGWHHVYGVDTAALTSLVNQGFRITDLEVLTVSPRQYAATLVHNSGSYARGWWWLIHATPSQLSTFLGQNQARLIDIEPVVSNGQLYFDAVMVHNVGAQAKSWWWYYGQSSASLGTRLTQNGARLVDLERYRFNGQDYLVGVMIRNAGADQRGWVWGLNATSPWISSQISQTNFRVYSLERVSSSTYDVILTQTTGVKWWYYYGLRLQQVADLAGQLGARVVDIESYFSFPAGWRYDVVFTNNSNALSTRMSELLRSMTDGHSGVYLKRVNGPVLAYINGDRVMDPASVLKTLHHTRAMRAVSQGLSLTTAIQCYNGAGPNSCPNSLTGPVQESLSTVLRKMMQNSDNTRTRAVTDYFGGFAGLNSTAAALGCTNTDVNHHIGCGTPANETTLVDLGKMHEAVRNGYVGSSRDTYYNLMIRWNGGGSLEAMIDQEAASVGLDPQRTAAFKSRMEWYSKGGNYGLPGPVFHRGSFGWTSLPFYVNGGIEDRGYVSGSFVNFATNDTNAGNAVGAARVEVFRDEVRAALVTWRNHVSGSFSAFGTGCQGSQRVPLHGGRGVPEIGQAVEYWVAATPGLNGVMNLGYSRTQWGALRLPFDLGIIGATGCFLYTDPSHSLAFAVGRSGEASMPLTIPLQRSLIGSAFYTQCLVLDRGANPAGLTTTRGVETSIGGQR